MFTRSHQLHSNSIVRGPLRFIARMALLTAFFVVFLHASTSVSAHAPGFAIALVDVQVQDAPEAEGQHFTMLPAGTTVVLTGDVAPGFVRVAFDGGSGWVNADLLSVSGRPGIATSVVTSRTLMLDAPFPDAAELAELERGEAVILTGAVVGDYAAASKDGIGGWVNRADIGPTPLE